MTTRRQLLSLTAAFAASTAGARAQGSYPDRPIRLVIGFPPAESAEGAAEAPGVRTVLASETSIWPEARLEGLGWVAFQPSPQDVAAGRPAVVRPLTPDEVPQQPTPDPTPSPSGSASGGGSGGESCDAHGGCAYPHDPTVDARGAGAIFAASSAFCAAMRAESIRLIWPAPMPAV